MTPIKQYLDERVTRHKWFTLEKQLAKIPPDVKSWDFFYLKEVQGEGEFKGMKIIDLQATAVRAERVGGEWYVLGPDELIG